MTQLDEFDRAILRILQKDNKTTQHKIGEAVNLSAPSVQRRIRRMEAEGMIRANVAIVDPAAVGLQLTIFVELELVSETPDEIDAVKKTLLNAPEVQQCFYVTGEVDFMVVVVVENMAVYEDFTRRMFYENGNIRKFKTFVSMDTIKSGSALGF
ncbi:Lrp/AsnC family transcriptional regulator [uncultured Ruegeria sp.]|uniref:Lrp/AsnC family transcriptional regulator n=1 Tax=uncultured Ruegeria sp. TaxID=259304 RepID=UPI00260BCC32|nr:Lrp/AsnC family transcriptional regulator [uncultured Ruegeria sp.]